MVTMEKSMEDPFEASKGTTHEVVNRVLSSSRSGIQQILQLPRVMTEEYKLGMEEDRGHEWCWKEETISRTFRSAWNY